MRPYALFFLPIAALAAEADAVSLARDIRARHMPHGTILDPVYTPSGEIASYSRCGDSAIWTGNFLAGESFRYSVSRSPEALDNVRAALAGIKTLFDVTGYGLLARCAFPADSPYAAALASEESGHGVYPGTIDGRPWQWIGETSRDQYLGVYFGLTVAWNLVPDPAIRQSIRDLTVQSTDHLRNHAWLITMPDGTIATTFLGFAHQQLAILKLAKRIDPGRFQSAYNSLATAGAIEALIPLAIDARDEHHSYFKFNLDYITYYCLLNTSDNFWVGWNYHNGYRILRGATDTHGDAFFDLIDRAVNGPASSRDARIRSNLDQWLTRPRRDEWIDLRGRYRACGEDQACDPIPVAQRVRTDFLWQRSPFLLYGGGSGTIEAAGIDYTLPYWMARYYRVLP